MDGYFEQEISYLERELSRLKTAAQRSSGTVETISKTVKVNISLSMNQAQTACSGYAYYTVEPESDSVVNATLDWYYEDVSVEWRPYRTGRAMSLKRFMLPDRRICVEIRADGSDWSGDNSDDLSKLKNGQSVSLSVNLTVQCTDKFTMGVYS